MARTFEPSTLVQFPRTSAEQTLALVGKVLSVADARASLPAGLQPVTARLKAAHAGLQQALVDRQAAAAAPAPASGTRELDAMVDQAWNALRTWLSAWTFMDDRVNPAVPAAKKLFAMLFPEGLTFTQLPYRAEWAEIETRLKAVLQGGYEATFAALAGQPFLDRVTELQKQYGELLHVTQPSSTAERDPVVRPAYDAALSALREYVVKVVAHAEPDQPATGELTQALLQPLAEWEAGPTA
jgi:hypothetical protein